MKRCVASGAAGLVLPRLVRCFFSNMPYQRFVLAEFIKASHVDTAQLVAFIKQCKLEPDWFMMQLPGG